MRNIEGQEGKNQRPGVHHRFSVRYEPYTLSSPSPLPVHAAVGLLVKLEGRALLLQKRTRDRSAFSILWECTISQDHFVCFRTVSPSTSAPPEPQRSSQKSLYTVHSERFTMKPSEKCSLSWGFHVVLRFFTLRQNSAASLPSGVRNQDNMSSQQRSRNHDWDTALSRVHPSFQI